MGYFLGDADMAQLLGVLGALVALGVGLGFVFGMLGSGINVLRDLLR